MRPCDALMRARRDLRALINGAQADGLSAERFRYLTGQLTRHLDDLELAIDPTRRPPGGFAVIDGDRR